MSSSCTRSAPGTADRSYGIHVARLAGLPEAVTARAEEVLQLLEKGEQGGALARLADDLPLFAPPSAAPTPSRRRLLAAGGAAARGAARRTDPARSAGAALPSEAEDGIAGLTTAELTAIMGGTTVPGVGFDRLKSP